MTNNDIEDWNTNKCRR